MSIITEKYQVNNYDETKLWFEEKQKEYYDLAFKTLQKINTIGCENILLDFMFNACPGYTGTKEEFANTQLFQKYIKTYEAFEDLFLYYLQKVAGNQYECKAQPFGPNSDGDIGIRKMGMTSDDDWFIIEVKSTRPKASVSYTNESVLSLTQYNNECGIGKEPSKNIEDMKNYFNGERYNKNICCKLGVMFFYHNHIIDHIELRPMPLFLNVVTEFGYVDRFAYINNGKTLKCGISSWVSKFPTPEERMNVIKNIVEQL